MVRCCSTTSVSRPCTRSTRLAWFASIVTPAPPSMVTSELTVSWLPPRTMVCPCTAGANSIRSAVRLSASASASASRKVSTPSSAVTSLVVVTMKVVATGGGLGSDWSSSKAPMSGLVPSGAGRATPRWSVAGALAGSARPSAGLSAASRRAMVWVGPPLSASPPANSRLSRHILAIARGIAVDVAAEDVQPVAGVAAATSGSLGACCPRRYCWSATRREIPPPRLLPAVLLPLTVLLVSVTSAVTIPPPRAFVTRRAVAADRAVGQRHVEPPEIPPPPASAPAVLLPLTVLLVSVTA